MMKWEENIRKVVPYVPGEQPKFADMVKLNTNECPYPPSPMVEKVKKEFETEDLRLYPDPACNQLVSSLAEYYGLKKEQVFVGVGSDDVLAVAFLTFFNSEKPILFPDITYSFYDVWADLYKIPYKVCSLDDEFKLRKEDYLQENGGIIFPNPNAPTGVLESVEWIEEIVAANQDSIVIIDEAYIDFGGESCIKLIDKYDNLLVVQTFSKSRAMAGIRIGYAMGNEKLIAYLNDVKYSINSYTMNLPSLEMGVAALQDDAYFKATVDKIVKTREWVKEEMKELGFDFTDSKSNFLFAQHKSVPAKEIYQMLREHKIFVRYWDKPRINNRLRITIGTDEEMKKLISCLKDDLKLSEQKSGD